MVSGLPHACMRCARGRIMRSMRDPTFIIRDPIQFPLLSRSLVKSELLRLQAFLFVCLDYERLLVRRLPTQLLVGNLVYGHELVMAQIAILALVII